MSGKNSKGGSFGVRSVLEFTLVFLVGYGVIQIGPAVKLRIEFVNAMEMEANAPIGKTAQSIKMDLIATAEGLGLTVPSENLHVVRNVDEKKTIITAYYQIHINFWPRFTYVWYVRDQVEGYLL